MNTFSNIGYEYGIKPNFMLVGDIEFSELFTKAECKGMLYVFAENEKRERIPVQMAFLFKNEEPAEQFMDILLGWIKKSNNDGDAVNIEFIENDKGGYALAISPEMTRFCERMIPKHLKDKITPLVLIQTHYKEIDTLGENYLNFKANSKKAENIAVGYVIGTPAKIVKQSKKYFTKKAFNFYKQNEIPSNSMARSYNATQDITSFDPKTLPKLPKDPIGEISERRISEMKTLLPLTYNRLNNLWLGEVQKKLSSKYDAEIVKQAICNLTIFERLKQSNDLSPNFTEEGYSYRILDYLLTSYESFDSYYPPDDFYTEDKITKQIKNDKKELETYLKK